MTLYELTQDLLALLEMAEDPEVEPEVLADTMEAVEGDFEVKADGYAKVMKELDAEADKISKEIARLTDRKKAITGNKDRIKKALEGAMIATGKTKFKTDFFSFGIQKNPASLKLDEELDFENIPAEYIVFPEPEINKNAVKDAIKAGAEFSWARLEQSEGLRVR